MLEELITEIKKARKISIFFHQRPDPDAFGSAFGLERWIKANFKVPVAVAHQGLIIDSVPEHLREYCRDIGDDFIQDSLAIIVDTANVDRIFDSRWKLCNKIIKIDHHPNVDPYGDINIVDTSKGATSELLLVDLIIPNKQSYESPIDSLIPLYTGLVTDTGRFKYKPTASTFRAAEWCLEGGINVNIIYGAIYKRQLNEVKLTGMILSAAHFDKGVAYVILPKDIKEKIKLPEHKLKNVNALADIEGFPIWVLTYYESERDSWRVSIRSNGIKINNVATKFNGGGHDQASGATVKNLDEFKSLINDLQELIS